MRTQTKKIVAITAFATFIVCSLIAAGGLALLQNHYDGKYQEYRDLERAFFVQRLKVEKEKLKANCRKGAN